MTHRDSRAARERSRRAAWLLGALLAVAPLPLTAQPQEPAADRPEVSGEASPHASGEPQRIIDEAVAQALFVRGKELIDQGDYANAKVLLSESLERSARGPVSGEALAHLQRCNAALGIPDPNHGAPPELQGTPAQVLAPLDPYAHAGGDETLDPYGGDTDILDPYDSPLDRGAGGDLEMDGIRDEGKGMPGEDDLAWGRRILMGYGAAYGLTAGLTLATGAGGEAALAAGLVGAGVGLGGTYLLTRSRPMTAGQAATIAWSGAWGGTVFGLLSDLVTGIDSSEPSEILWGVTLGGLAGTGVGWLVARKVDPSPGDVALVNSLGLYGALGSLLIGVGLDPAESEAYSLNALFGAALGLGVGLYAAPRLEVSRRRMVWVDLGAAAGALIPWVVIYPLLHDEGRGGVQVTGWISTLGLFGGAYLAWRGTEGMDDEPLRIGKKQIATVPALLQRWDDGQWGVGTPSLRPVGYPALAPAAGRGLAVALIGGHF